MRLRLPLPLAAMLATIRTWIRRASAWPRSSKEMKAAGADFRIITYPGAKHSFTNVNAAKSGVPGLAYNAAADQKSWAELL